MESFRERVCLRALLEAQNQDGGWGYRRSSQSAVEPSSWAILALAGAGNLQGAGAAVQNAVNWLRSVQLPDRSWPACAGLPEGCWVTALAGLALYEQGIAEEAARGAADWLCSTWPAEGAVWRRWLNRLTRGQRVVRIDLSLRGWSWTQGTSSWVEPTAVALIFLKRMYAASAPSNVAKRIKLAEAMLYDRMCPSGGWNSGNPQVYGVAGEPLAGPTAWALLALQNYPERQENRQSLEGLVSAASEMRSPGSLAVSELCLAAYGRKISSLPETLEVAYDENRFLGNILVTAWCALALGDPVDWLCWSRAKEHA